MPGGGRRRWPARGSKPRRPADRPRRHGSLWAPRRSHRQRLQRLPACLAQRYAICSRCDSVSIRARRTPHKLRKLLVIDDDTKLLASYRDLLSPYGFEVLTAPDGQDAIPLVERNPDIQLVILDLAMPRMDGREWLR